MFVYLIVAIFAVCLVRLALAYFAPGEAYYEGEELEVHEDSALLVDHYFFERAGGPQLDGADDRLIDVF